VRQGELADFVTQEADADQHPVVQKLEEGLELDVESGESVELRGSWVDEIHFLADQVGRLRDDVQEKLELLGVGRGECAGEVEG
jgi:uncharacterized protein YabE (DUF348 family)